MKISVRYFVLCNNFMEYFLQNNLSIERVQYFAYFYNAERSSDSGLIYFQMNYGLLLYLKLARVDVGNVSKKGENMEGIITWSIFTSLFLTKLCLYILDRVW